MRAIGLMSGTSLDGVDAVLVDLSPRGLGYSVKTVEFATLPFEPEFRNRLLDRIVAPSEPAPATLAEIDRELGRHFTVAALTVSRGRRPDFVASHGLTIYHDGASQRTLQLGDPYLIRDALEASVVFDFRRADCAAGGEGAPLVPYVDALLFGSASSETIALNIGGIANVTVIPRDASPTDVRAWDTGPGNVLLDAFVRRRTKGAQTYDADGGRALGGTVDRALLARMLRDPYFKRSPPKSTGREHFGAAFLERYAKSLRRRSLNEGCATLAALSVEAIVRDVERYGPAEGRVVVSGGGVRNRALLAGVAFRLGSSYEVMPSDDLGIDPDAKEAIAFAILGYETLRGHAAGLPAVTGAKRAAVLGAIAPFELAKTLEKMEREIGRAGGSS